MKRKSGLKSKPEWFRFQDKICAHFRSMVAFAESNISVEGTRTKHAIDVFVKTKFLGQDIIWIIEAKKWNKRINKLHVLALRTIVSDIGADKGFIISEKGYQVGATEAAIKTNISLISLADFFDSTKEFVQIRIIDSYKKRLSLLEHRYWSHSKKIRIKYGLRDEIWTYPVNFSGQNLLYTAHLAIAKAERNEYPIDLNTYMIENTGNDIAANFYELTNWLNLNLNFIDEKILGAEMEMVKKNEFKPDLIERDNDDLPIHIIMKAKSKIKPPDENNSIA